PIPRELSGAGQHRLTVRVAPQPPPRIPWFHGIAIGDLEQMLRSRIVGQVVPLSGFVLFLVIGVFHFMLWLTRQCVAPAARRLFRRPLAGDRRAGSSAAEP